MGCDSDGTSEHEEWFEGGRRIVYKQSVVGIGGFPFVLSFLGLLYSKASYDLEPASTVVLTWFPWYELWVSSALFAISHLSFHYHLRPTPPVTLEWVWSYRTWYWMCLYPSTGCKYCFEPCSVSCWVYVAPNSHWIHVCDDCVDELLRLTGFDICQYPHRSPYWNVKVRQ